MHATPTSSIRLLEQARNGDADSLGMLLRKYFRYLNSLSASHLDPRIRLRVSPSDLVQETLLEAHCDFPKFVGASLEEFTGWLRKILFNNLSRAVENHILAGKRDVRRQQSLDEQAPGKSSTQRWDRILQGDCPPASAVFRQNETLSALTRAIGRLPDDYQLVIRLRNFEGLTFASIASRLDRNPGATRMLWIRAVERLRSLMAPDLEQ